MRMRRQPLFVWLCGDMAVLRVCACMCVCACCVAGERVVIERFTPGHVGTYACVIETPNGKTRWGEWIVQQAGV